MHAKPQAYISKEEIMVFDAPVISPPRGLEPAWLDHNGHLNMAYYKSGARGAYIA